MRLWHKDVIKYLPQKQLVAQWRECCAIASNLKKKGTPNHMLVNKVLWYNKSHFYNYCCLIIDEMYNRGYKVNDSSKKKIFDYVSDEERQIGASIENDELFKSWHDERYLIQCYFNLQEKYDCGGVPENQWDVVYQNLHERILKNMKGCI